MIDIVLPNKNESEFIKTAKLLGFDSLCFLYSLKDARLHAEQIKKLQQETETRLFLGVIAGQNEIQKAKAFADLVLVRTPQNSQHIIEKEKPDIVFDLELNPQPDSMHFRASGLNHVLCKAAEQSKVIIGISLSTILGAQNKPKLLGRISQNITLCKKYKVQVVFASFAHNITQMKSPHELESLAVVLGMNQKQAEQSISSALARAELNIKKKSKHWISEGIEIIN